MKNDLSLNPQQITRGLSRFMHRYHVIVFVLIVVGGLSAATFSLYQTVVSSQLPEATPPSTTFDTQTIEKIKGLRSADDASAPLVLPPGRTNPFEG